MIQVNCDEYPLLALTGDFDLASADGGLVLDAAVQISSTEFRDQQNVHRLKLHSGR